MKIQQIFFDWIKLVNVPLLVSNLKWGNKGYRKDSGPFFVSKFFISITLDFWPSFLWTLYVCVLVFDGKLGNNVFPTFLVPSFTRFLSRWNINNWTRLRKQEVTSETCIILSALSLVWQENTCLSKGGAALFLLWDSWKNCTIERQAPY